MLDCIVLQMTLLMWCSDGQTSISEFHKKQVGLQLFIFKNTGM